MSSSPRNTIQYFRLKCKHNQHLKMFQPRLHIDPSTMDEISYNRESMQMEWSSYVFDYKRKHGREPLYENQLMSAQRIIQVFASGKNMVLLISGMQAGKTGVMLALAYYMCTHPDDNLVISKTNVHFITGLSDNAWISQNRDYLPRSFAENLEHRPKLDNQFGTHFNELSKNVLIIIDESHIAASKEQTLDKLFKKLSLDDVEKLRERNIYILLVSATPNNTGYYTDKYDEICGLIKMPLAQGYIGLAEIKQDNRLLQAKNLSKPENILEYFQIIESRYPPSLPKYHIIRCLRKTGELAKIAIKDMCKTKGWKFDEHDSVNRIKKIDDKLLEQPATHTVIFIKDFYRASKCFEDTNIGSVYDLSSDDSVTAQGLAGRMCGFNKRSGADAPLVFVNLECADRYIKWLNNKESDYRQGSYQSATLKSTNGQVKVIPSFVTRNADEDSETTEVQTRVTHDNIKKFEFELPENMDDKDFKELVEKEIRPYYSKYTASKFKAFNKPETDNGFYLSVIRSDKRVWSYDNVWDLEYRSGLSSKKNRVRHYFAYHDLKDNRSGKLIVCVFVDNEI